MIFDLRFKPFGCASTKLSNHAQGDNLLIISFKHLNVEKIDTKTKKL